MNDDSDDRALIDALGRGPRTPLVRPGAGSMIEAAAIRSSRRRTTVQAAAAFVAVLVVAMGVSVAASSSHREPPAVRPPAVVSSSIAVTDVTSRSPSDPTTSDLATSRAPTNRASTSSAPTGAQQQTFPAGTRLTFTSQDGKVRCASGDQRGLLVHCQTAAPAATLPGPDPCQGAVGATWGKDVALLPQGWAAFTCGVDVLQAGSRTLAAGNSLKIGDVTCSAKSASEIDCRSTPIGQASAATIVLRGGRTVSAAPGNTFGKRDVDPAGRQFTTGFITRLTSNSLSFQPAYQVAQNLGSDGYQLWWLPDMGAKESSVSATPDTRFFSCCSLGRDGVMGTVEGPDDYGTLRTQHAANQLMPDGTPTSPILVVQQRRGAMFPAADVYERFTSSANDEAIRALTRR